MFLLRFIRRNILLILLIIGIIIIFAELRLIYNINSRNNGGVTSVKSDLKGYDSFRQKVNELALDKKVTNNSDYGRLIRQLNLIENRSLSSKDKYKAITEAQSDITFLYTNTHNSKFRDLNSSLEYVAKANFANYYQKANFTMYCQDTICQDTPQSKEILKIIDEIKTSSVAGYSKQSNINNLFNVGYISKNDIDAKIYSYVVMAKIIRNDGEFVKAGLSTKIANEIDEYLLNKYPDIINKILGLKTIEESRLKLEGK